MHDNPRDFRMKIAVVNKPHGQAAATAQLRELDPLRAAPMVGANLPTPDEAALALTCFLTTHGQWLDFCRVSTLSKLN